MNLAQSGYHMLMILSVVDGKYDVAEGKVIVDYLVKNYQLNIDIDKENQALLAIEENGLPQHFRQASQHFQINSTHEQRVDFIAFAYRLVEADGVVGREENKILSSLANSWNIDIEPLLSEKKLAADLRGDN